MSRLGCVIAAACAAAAWSPSARADAGEAGADAGPLQVPEVEPAAEGSPRGEGSPAAAGAEQRNAEDGDDDASGGEAASDARDPLPADQELGASVGVALGGRATPGGLRIGGHYLFRLARRDWLEAGVTFTFGSGREACFRDRSDQMICEHGFASGFAADARAVVARFFGSEERFRPYARAGLSGRVLAFPGDRIRGLAAPAIVGAGVRSRVHEDVAVTGGAEVRAGPAWLSRGVGLEPQISFAITAGVDFTVLR